jgi:galactose mutarotase-like enzyme
LECGGKRSATPLSARRAASPLRVASALQNFFLLKTPSKLSAPLVCIEPWCGYADTEQPYGDITKKPGIRLLPAGETFTCTHRVSIQ